MRSWSAGSCTRRAPPRPRTSTSCSTRCRRTAAAGLRQGRTDATGQFRFEGDLERSRDRVSRRRAAGRDPVRHALRVRARRARAPRRARALRSDPRRERRGGAEPRDPRRARLHASAREPPPRDQEPRRSRRVHPRNGAREHGAALRGGAARAGRRLRGDRGRRRDHARRAARALLGSALSRRAVGRVRLRAAARDDGVRDRVPVGRAEARSARAEGRGCGLRRCAARSARARDRDGALHRAARRAIAAGGSLALDVAAAPSAPAPLRTPRSELWLELDDAALEVEQRIEVVVEGEGAPLTSSGGAAPVHPAAAGDR